MTTAFFQEKEGRYADYDLKLAWDGNIEIENLSLKYAPETDKNQDEGLLVSITGKYLVDGPEGSGIQKGKYLQQDLWCRNRLQENWQEIFGELKDATKKDGTATKALVPKFTPTNVKYRISWANVVNKATGETKTVVSTPRVLGVWDDKRVYIPLGSMDDKREFTGESEWALAEE